ncbi:MAG: efflux RND transporter permease subunit [Deferribacteres bacterium]|nr:efflux RND transporter permease subunit [candidate division KSB1 bacterium]MCB9508954.1 efflux RND transporter permease subunit [Deferribacteres bacterium]
MNIAEFSVKKPITMLMVLVSIVVLGFLGLKRLPLTFIPEIESQRLRISVPYQSSSPQEIERNITRPIEEMMGTLPNLEKISSTSSANQSNVSVEFMAGTDMDLASVEVRDRLDRVRPLLPSDVERVRIFRWQSSDLPVYEFSIAWKNRTLDELHETVNKVIIPRIQRIEGVANVEIRGMDERQVMVELDMERMRAHKLDFFNLARSLRTNNINVSAGTVLDAGKKYSVRVIGEFKEVDEIAQVPIDGTTLVLGDVAKVSFSFPEKTNFQRLDQAESIVVRVYKASTANIIDVAKGVQAYIKELGEEPKYAELRTQVFRDQSSEILNSLSNLTWAGIFGGLLANLVLFFFLRKVRSTIIIGMSIPISILATFLIMYILRLGPINSTITLNLVSLSGLMFAVGMLVDPAVVVLENIFRHKQEEGLDAREASIVGAREIAVAVTSASLTTVIVFVPMIFMSSGRMGRFMIDFGVAIVSATAASLVVSLTLIPLAASRIFTGKERQKAVFLVKLGEWYGNSISKVTRVPFAIASLGLLALISYGVWDMYQKLDRSYMPRTPQRQMDLRVDLDRNFSFPEISAIFDSVETVLIANKDDLEIMTVATNFSRRRASVTVYFTPEDQANKSTTELYDEVRNRLPMFAGVEYRVGRMHGRGGGDEGVSIELKGKSTEVLVTYAERIRALLKDVEGIKDIDTSMERGDEEVRVSVDRFRAQKYGLSSQQVASTISSALTSRANSKYKTQDREVDILMQLSEEDRVNMQQLGNMALANNRGEMVQLGSVAALDMHKGPESIQREDRQTTITVFANTDSDGLWKVNMEIDKAMASIELPPGYSWSKGRNWRLMQETEQESNFAIILAVVLIYIVMASLFESFVHPFTILFSVPFALIGVVFFFSITGTTLTNMSYMGIIVVCGLVVNNGIILIDAINKRRRDGMSRAEAIRIGGRNRLRPILMTTLTTIIGLMPIVLPVLFPGFLGAPEGSSNMYVPVGIAVVGGLLTSTPLTLFIMPILYVIIDEIALWFAKVTARVHHLRRPAAQEAVGN